MPAWRYHASCVAESSSLRIRYLVSIVAVGGLLAGCQNTPTPAPSPAATPQATPTRTELKVSLNADQADLQMVNAIAEKWQRGAPPPELVLLTEKSKNSSDLSVMLAQLLTLHGALDWAWSLSRQALKMAPDDPVALVNMGHMERRLGLVQDAEKHLRAALAAAPNALETHAELAQLLQDREQYAEAEKEWAEALRRDDKNPALWGAVVSCQLRQDNFAGARETLAGLEKLLRDSPVVLIQGAEIDRQEARKSPAKAPELQKQAASRLDAWLKKNPGHAPALALRGMLYEEMGDDKQARKHLENAFIIAPELPELRVRLAQILLRTGAKKRGELLMRIQRDNEKRVEEKRRLGARVGSNPDDMEARRALARWCDANKEPTRAHIEWEAIAEKLPNDAEAKAALAQFKKRPTPAPK